MSDEFSGPFDRPKRIQIQKQILLLFLVGVLGIGAALAAVYFLSGRNAAGTEEKLRAAVQNTVRVRTVSQSASGSRFSSPRLNRRMTSSTSSADPSAVKPQNSEPSQFAAIPIASPSSIPTKFGKILISEIQIEGTSKDDEFIEFYNPNDFAVSLEGWTIKKKTAGGKEYALISEATLKGKTIEAKSYFLAARTGSAIPITPDVLWPKSNTIAENNTIVIYGKLDGKTVIVDAVGFGDAYEFEGAPAPNPGNGETLSRKSANDTDNNAADFIISVASPRNSKLGAGFINPQAAPSPIPTPSPTPASSPSPLQSPSPILTSSPQVTPTPSPSPSPTPSPSPIPSPSPSPTPTPTPQPSSSPSPSPSPTIAARKILINEVQIAGATAYDEFVELYNPGDSALDLSGWALKKKTSSGTESNLVSKTSFTGVIPARGFFLIAHQTGYTGSVAPDLRYSGSTYSVSASSTVLLYDASGLLIDEVGFGGASDFESAPALNPANGQSIERKNFQDTDNNADDFGLLDTPTPQNSQSG